MVHRLSPLSLTKLSQLIAAQVGLYLPKERWRDLERGISSAAEEFGFEDIEECAAWLLSSPLNQNQIEVLATHLTIGETYFFREQKSLDIFESHILKNLLAARQGRQQQIRIWSAGCCTGEEPYTLAIILHKLIPDLKDWNITILATDINPDFLEKATKGVYRDWSFRRTPAWIKEQYFREVSGEQYEILPHIKQMVTFSYLNLIEDSYPSLSNNTNSVDVIFCRNVLMYFSRNTIQTVVKRFHRCLFAGGWFLVSPTEVSSTLYSPFTTVNFPGAIFYQKNQRQLPALEKLTKAIPSSSRSQFAPHNVKEIPRKGTNVAVSGLKATAPALKPDGQLFSRQGVSSRPAQPASNSRHSVYEKAATLYKQGHYQAVASELEKVFAPNQQLNPDMSLPEEKAVLMLIRAYANQRQLTQAKSLCSKVIAVDKLNPTCHYLLSTILQEQGEFEQSIKSLKRALFLDYNFVLAHFSMGNLTLQQGKFAESNRHFNNALGLLRNHQPDDLVPESEGITARRLTEIITTLKNVNGKKL